MAEAMNRIFRKSLEMAGIIGFRAHQMIGWRSRILIHLDWNLGDEIMAIPLFAGLKEKYPNFVLGVQSRYPELFAYNPYVNTVNPPKLGILDRQIDIRGEGLPTPRLEFWEKLLGIEIDDRQPRLYFSEEERHAIHSIKHADRPCKRVAISTGTTWQSKRWPQENFRSLANQLSNGQTAIRFIEMGQACPWLGIGKNWIDRTSIREAAVLLASCDLFIGSDSGLMHLAAAAGTPAIGLFGPVDPYSLVGDNKLVFSIFSPVPCKGCWTQRRMQKRDHCPLGKPICMEAVSPAVVCQLALQILDGKRSN